MSLTCLQIQKYKAYKQKRAKKSSDRSARDLGNVILKHGAPETAYLAAKATEVGSQPALDDVGGSVLGSGGEAG